MNQKTALEVLSSGHNTFLTGAPGTGKTYVINAFISYLQERGIFPSVVAPTGIAASHIRGQTIHSFFGLGIKDRLTDEDIDKILGKSHVLKNLKKLKILIIDEVSMLSPGVFYAIDLILRSYHLSTEPFGGIQVVLSGDFFQLPPVQRDGGAARFIWQTELWEDLDLSICYLDHSYRQGNDPLLQILQEIRKQDISEESMNYLRSRYRRLPHGTDTPTKLYTHNADIDRINEEHLTQIPGQEKIFDADCYGNAINLDRLFKSTLAERELHLKVGAQVMFIKNSVEQGYINGTLGVVTGFEGHKGTPVVETVSGHIIRVSQQEWLMEDQNKKLIASVQQLPLKLAWAITIHKSQGMTLDTAEVDLSKTFELGQGYVALSRIKSIHGLTLMGMNDIALRVDDEVRELDDQLREHSGHLDNQWSTYTAEATQKAHDAYITMLGGYSEPRDVIQTSPKKRKDTYQETLAFLLTGKTLEEIATLRGLHVSTIAGHLDKLYKDNPDLDISHLKPDRVLMMQLDSGHRSLVAKGNAEDFSEDGKVRLKALYEELDGALSYDQIRLGLLFLKP